MVCYFWPATFPPNHLVDKGNLESKQEEREYEMCARDRDGGQAVAGSYVGSPVREMQTSTGGACTKYRCLFAYE